MCDKVVCERWCVSEQRGGRGGGGGRAGWCRIKNKNPTQRCGEKNIVSSEIYTGWWYTYPSEKYEFVSWDDDIPN